MHGSGCAGGVGAECACVSAGGLGVRTHACALCFVVLVCWCVLGWGEGSCPFDVENAPWLPSCWMQVPMNAANAPMICKRQRTMQHPSCIRHPSYDEWVFTTEATIASGRGEMIIATSASQNPLRRKIAFSHISTLPRRDCTTLRTTSRKRAQQRRAAKLSPTGDMEGAERACAGARDRARRQRRDLPELLQARDDALAERVVERRLEHTEE
jgi:hypothetical protein